MRNRILALLMMVLVVLMAVTPGLVFAQNPSVEWKRWDAQIAVRPNDQLQIAETQEIQITDGSIRKGQRYWTTDVDVQSVFLIVDNGTPQQLTQSSSEQPSTYKLSTTSGQTTLDYVLPAPQSSGKSFIVQINYTAASPTTGMVDWRVIPTDRDFAVRSSTVRISFPEGEAPDASLIRASGNVEVNTVGNAIEIRSTNTIAASQGFSIQVPYGAGVGAPAGNSGNSGNAGNPINPNPTTPRTTPPTEVELPGSTLIFILCIIGVVLLFGGGNLLRSLLGSLLGGGGVSQPGGSFGPTLGGGRSSNPVNSEQPTSSGGRGFRSSGNQDRSVGGKIGSDKDSGGGASFS